MNRKTREPSKVEHASQGVSALAMRHLRFGWWSLLVFLSLGLLLEALHGFKVGWYLEIANSSRRFAWTLAHAHGTLLAVINLLFGATLHRLSAWSPRWRALASTCLLAATVLLPGGFFLGGLFPYEGDPGIGIFLVPVGGGLLAVGVLLIALSCRGAARD
jgi:hypothetical protein